MVHKEYLIFYLVDEEEKQVNIMAIFNSKKDYMRVMKNFILKKYRIQINLFFLKSRKIIQDSK